MKTDIHPEYVECRVHCSCGNDFTTRATVTELRVELCAECHPFYTGKQKLVDTGGRVERFERRYAGAPEAPAKKEKGEEEGGRTKTVRTKTRKAPIAARPQRAKFEKTGKGEDGEGRERKPKGAKAEAKEDAPAEEAPAPEAPAEDVAETPAENADE